MSAPRNSDVKRIVGAQARVSAREVTEVDAEVNAAEHRCARGPTSSVNATDAGERWRRHLESWAIPPAILEAAPAEPWSPPRDAFVRRADASLAHPGGVAFARALEALPEGGSVLDVGAGAGAASLPLLDRAGTLVAVDQDAQLLAELLARGGARAGRLRTVVARWPEVAAATPTADVVVCHHVLFNVPDLAPFVHELTDHAHRRVVVVITPRHPVAGLNPLWLRFHGLRRPERPTWEDAAEALRALGLDPVVERDDPPGEPGFATFEELVAFARRRLCLGSDRDPEVAEALRAMGADPNDDATWSLRGPGLVIFWWRGAARRPG